MQYKSSYFSIGYSLQPVRMEKYNVILTFFLSITLSFVAAQQNCHGRCRTVCDDEPSSLSGPSPLSRGKKGPKGDVGPPGQKGESNKHVTSKHASKLERLERIVERQSALIEKQSALFEETSLKVNNQSETIERQSALIKENSLNLGSQSETIERQSVLIKENSVLIDQLSSWLCVA